ncbi:MAG: hypothetical protein LBL49_07765 [Clostridiales Family XIII bacterium]|jgi:hypothetical protein|nr:hypothetical protein [Clostridiales Family XIII bacterium]
MNGGRNIVSSERTDTDIKVAGIVNKIREMDPSFFSVERIHENRNDEGASRSGGFAMQDAGKKKNPLIGDAIAAFVATLMILSVFSVFANAEAIQGLKLKTANVWDSAKAILAEIGKHPDAANYVVLDGAATLTIGSMGEINIAKEFLPDLLVPEPTPTGFELESLTVEKSDDGGYSVEYVYKYRYKNTDNGKVYISCVKIQGDVYDIGISGGAGAIKSDVNGVDVYVCDDGGARFVQFILNGDLFKIGAEQATAYDALGGLTAAVIDSRS